MNPSFSPANQKLFFTRQDPADPRLGEMVKTAPVDAPGVAIVGYPDDEGVALNGGRTGAKLGPDAIREWLYRMTPHPRLETRALFDLGNLKTEAPIGDRHNLAADAVKELLGRGHKVLALGGGNDYAFADGWGFLQSLKSDTRPVIVNIDAHLDVRDLSRGLTSGTPFYRLLESEHEFHFIEIGMQSVCNAKSHWDYVEKKGGKIISMDEILECGAGFHDYVTRELGDLLRRKIPAYIAIDIDAFAYPFAKGSSAPWPLGIDPHQFYTTLKLLLNRWDVRVLGIYEVSPELENGTGTAKLAAQWAHMFLHV